MTGRTITAFGANSLQGQKHVSAALAAGYAVREVTRSADIFSGWAQHGLEILDADYADPASLTAACKGADILLYRSPQD